MSISKIRDDAKVALAGKFGKGIGILFAYLGFCFLVGIIQGIIAGILGEESIVVSLLQIVVALFEVPLALGLTYSYIKLKRNEEVKAFDFVNLAFSNFGRAWKIGLRELLKMILPIIGIVASLLIIMLAGVYSTASATLGFGIQSSIGLVFVGLILYFVSIVWLFIRSLLYAVSTMVAYDNPDMRSLEVVNESARLMKGNRAIYIVLCLTYAVWFIIPVVIALLGLALPAIIVLLALYVWLFPNIQVAYVCFYDELVGRNTNNNIENNTESNDEAITEM